ncbi:DNA mismatch repair protein [Apilactobacillus ozensis DSM 23829 = JCM 17196]|uniref:DNA mismatch repair protein MutL n=1 Tax=Apilactobacillus ozensis DSM 23829 = JCM 17196 TaxID=1423781 RepID=A0A0R2ANX5_9LACO|nr:DNA mismatch repair endonuclease MutL [Apilactobacillus ozensis]KRM68378.1 DNA mismatch repair protein [Apilactobacillus ozensis DSM 23829 = JCM 17196]
MSKIRELSSILSDQIAAGEVIERPASVVKELIENSIDAGSTEIDIEVKDAGLQYIKVVDNGSGIESDDVKLAFKRHATSKIHNRKDLFKISSLGFRGEALPSIASIANVKLKTSTGSGGTELNIRGGEILRCIPAEARKGTTVEVSDLFFNTPARLKYMKSPATELSKITDVVNQISLGHAEISFSLRHNNRELVRTSGRNNLQQVIGGIYSLNTVKKMVKISSTDDDFKISGYTSLPEMTRASRKYISIMMNGRYVKDNNIVKAVLEGYRSKLMIGRYPMAVIKIDLDPLLLDVNVHPTKQTVRISKEEQLCSLISLAIFKALEPKNLIPDAMDKTPIHSNENRLDTNQLNLKLNDASKHYLAKSQNEDILDDIKLVKNNKAIKSNNNSQHESVMVYHKSNLNSDSVKKFDERYNNSSASSVFNDVENDVTDQSTDVNDFSDTALKTTRRFPNLLYIGQMHGTYLLAEASDGMYILDQHAAQERINYEYYRSEIGKVSNNQQELLMPIVLDYSTSDALIINQNLDKLSALGIELESFGSNSFIIRNHPAWFKKGQEQSIIQEMIDWILDDKKISVGKFRLKTAIMMSCKRAIKANHHLDKSQAVALIKKLSEAENPFNCPHGRPVLVHFSNSDMEKMFKRIQDNHETDILD